ncbi:hypothetical protein [Thalassospira xiamenensis]|uniref:Uncharacterized protein n=1 Tax=Thalassospira xiamenensis TaxID=220697 RepID=A0ABR5XWN8_9PROT|nr:hypothetical protein [Thalassospira xiamenensis]KZC97218.1 hypothetical protein AUP40_04575 [Thalassospira xiamenensis]KZD10189.1 hypothetical protein AUP45_02635 [Thalassospira xiamenensis]MCD1593163.1 hypothetical protein [Thalassospira xiamenensis]
MTIAITMKGARRIDTGDTITLARIDRALAILARIMRDQGDLFEDGQLMALAKKLYDERNRISQPAALENLMSDLMKSA